VGNEKFSLFQRLDPKWRTVLADGLADQAYVTAYGRDISTIVLPSNGKVFRAFELTPFDKVRVVILGQDPYHTVGKPTGLAFGVPKDWKQIGSSIKNVLEEVRRSVGTDVVGQTLEGWAEQGVLLLNTRLTVEAGRPLSHARIGWENVTKTVLSALNEAGRPIVFLLWGREAQQFGKLITNHIHTKLETSHPCKFSAHRGFVGCDHFSKANKILKLQGIKYPATDTTPIDWSKADV